MEDKEHCMSCGVHRSQLQETPWGRYKGDNVWAIQCKPCREDEIKKQIEDFQASEPDTEYTDAAICPYCGYKHEQDSVTSELYTEGDHDFECSNCNNEFTLSTSISITYSTYKKEE